MHGQGGLPSNALFQKDKTNSIWMVKTSNLYMGKSACCIGLAIKEIEFPCWVTHGCLKCCIELSSNCKRTEQVEHIFRTWCS